MQALFLNDYPFAYYVHCLTPIATSREVHSIHDFFNNLTFIINSIDATCKCSEELQIA